MAILSGLVKVYGVHSLTVREGSIFQGLDARAAFMNSSRASRSTVMGPGVEAMVSLPAMGARPPMTEIRLRVGLERKFRQSWLLVISVWPT